MREELQEIEHIENYLMGKLTAQERRDFEKEMDANNDLKERVELQEALTIGLERLGLKTELKKISKQVRLRKFLINTLTFLMIVIPSIWLSIEFDQSGDPNQEEIPVIIDTVDGEQRDKMYLPDSILNEEERIEDTVNTKSGPVNKLDTSYDFAKLPVKLAQTFKIDPTKLNAIKGEEGTLIEIPANAFQTNSNEPVEIKLKEFYKLSDMVFANLTTQTTEGDLLETGGMIHIEANQGENKQLQLASDKRLSISFPCQEKKEGMKLFKGAADAYGSIIWNSVKTENKEIVDNDALTAITYSWRHITEPKFVYLDQNSTAYLNDLFRFPTIDSKKIKGKVYVSIGINKRGEAISSEINRGERFPPELYPYAKRAAMLMPPVIPERKGNRYVTHYTVELTLDEALDKRMLAKNAVELYYDSLERISQKQRIPTLEELNRINQFIREEERDSVRKRLISETELKENDLSNYVVLSVSGMGWLNCDRDLSGNRPRLTLKVRHPDPKLQLTIISHSYKSVARPKRYRNGEYRFYYLPKGEELSLLAIKSSEVKKEISYKEITNDGSAHDLEFIELTPDRLESIVSQIDRLHN